MTETRTFFTALAGTASVLGVLYIGTALVAGQQWISDNAALILSHGIYWLIVPPVLAILLNRNSNDSFSPPKVRKVLEGGILLVEQSDWLSHRTSVAVYIAEDDVERLACAGEVVNIQSNGLIQIETIPISDIDLEETLRSQRQNLLVKPGIRA